MRYWQGTSSYLWRSKHLDTMITTSIQCLATDLYCQHTSSKRQVERNIVVDWGPTPLEVVCDVKALPAGNERLQGSHITLHCLATIVEKDDFELS